MNEKPINIYSVWNYSNVSSNLLKKNNNNQIVGYQNNSTSLISKNIIGF